MRISWIKSKNDNKSFMFFQNMGFDVECLDDLEETDKKIEELIDKKCNTIILSNEVAAFSEDIIKKYTKDESVNIIIARNKKEY